AYHRAGAAGAPGESPRMTATLADVGIVFGRVFFVMMFILNLGGLLTWVERKQSAIMQDRIGANRASILGFRALGLFHPLADAIKMLTKEDFRPARADRFLFSLAPFVSVFFALVAFASIPFGDTLRVGDRVIPLQAVTLNVGVLYVFAMLSLGVYGVMMAGWSYCCRVAGAVGVNPVGDAGRTRPCVRGGGRLPSLMAAGFHRRGGAGAPPPQRAVAVLAVGSFVVKVCVVVGSANVRTPAAV